MPNSRSISDSWKRHTPVLRTEPVHSASNQRSATGEHAITLWTIAYSAYPYLGLVEQHSRCLLITSHVPVLVAIRLNVGSGASRVPRLYHPRHGLVLVKRVLFARSSRLLIASTDVLDEEDCPLNEPVGIEALSMRWSWSRWDLSSVCVGPCVPRTVLDVQLHLRHPPVWAQGNLSVVRSSTRGHSLSPREERWVSLTTCWMIATPMRKVFPREERWVSLTTCWPAPSRLSQMAFRSGG
jgi:hypothetical protein